MGVLGGIAVSAAGQLAGGYAAEALMGDTSYPKGGGIEGLTSTDPGKSGIPPTVQIEPEKALEYFQKAAGAFEENAQKGLAEYKQSLEQAKSTLNVAYKQADDTLRPLRQMGGSALNQYMRMLGLDTPSPTQDVYGQVSALGANYAPIAQQIRAAEQFRDPAQRAQAKKDIINALTVTNNLVNQEIDYKRQQELAALSRPTGNEALTGIDYGSGASSGLDLKGLSELGKQKVLGTARSQLTDKLNKEYEAKVQEINQRYNSQINWQAAEFAKQYDRDYSENPEYFGFDAAQSKEALSVIPGFNKAMSVIDNYDPDKIKRQAPLTTAELQKTPGYQFMYDQGNKAVMRAAAAGGLLGSGNTLTAASKFSQGLAEQVYQYENNFREGQYQFDKGLYDQQYTTNQNIVGQQYTNYMNNLMGMGGIGANAINQTASNQIGLGNSVANLTQSGGQAAMNTYQNIGQALYNSLTNQGNTWNTDMLANMSAQNQAISSAYGRASAEGIAGGQQAISGGYLNLQNTMFANQVANQQGQASGFNAAMGMGGGGNGWPTWNGTRWSI